MTRLAVCIALLAINAAPAQRPPSLEARLKAELVNNVFKTRLVVGNVLIIEEQVRILSGPGTPSRYETRRKYRLVDTNLYPDGNVLLNRRTSFLDLMEGSPVMSSSCNGGGPYNWLDGYLAGDLCRLLPGTTVRVDSISLIADRLELALTSLPQGHYGKLKYIFGTNWQKTMDYETVMEGVSRGVVIERFERAPTLIEEYDTLTKQIRSVPPTQSDSVGTRLEQAKTRRESLDRLIRNRQAFAQLGKPVSAEESNGYAAEVRRLDEEIPRLEAQLRTENLSRLRDDLASAEQKAAADKNRATGLPPRTLDDLKGQEGALSVWEKSLQRVIEVDRALAELGDRSSGAAGRAETDVNDIRKRRADLAAMRPKLEAANANAAYAQMQAEEKKLRSAYTAAFETPKQREAAAQFRRHVQAMIANRESAQRSGDTAATAELKRLQTVLASIR